MTVDLNNTNLLTVRQVAKLLHMHPNTVRRWSDKGILKSYCIFKADFNVFKRYWRICDIDYQSAHSIR